VVKKLSKKNKS